MISLSGVSKSFDTPFGPRRVLRDVSLEIGDGEVLAVIGANGSGKTTLLRVIAGLLGSDEGQVTIAGDAERPTVSIVPQRYRESLFPWRNVGENVHLPFENNALDEDSGESVTDLIDGILEYFGIRDFKQSRIGTLSGGQAQLVALARGLVAPWQKVLLLDEPFSALDGANLELAATNVIKITENRGASTVVITHDLDVGLMIATRVLVLSGSGPKSVRDVFEFPKWQNLDPSLLANPDFLECKSKVLQSLMS